MWPVQLLKLMVGGGEALELLSFDFHQEHLLLFTYFPYNPPKIMSVDLDPTIF